MKIRAISIELVNAGKHDGVYGVSPFIYFPQTARIIQLILLLPGTKL